MKTKLFLGMLTCCLAVAIASGQPYDLSWHTTDGGGAMVTTGGTWELSGTIGQPDAGAVMLGGRFQLTGGFWFEQPPGDCNATGIADLFDHSDFADCLSGPDGGLLRPDCNCFDVDGDGDNDLFDAALIQESFPG